MDSCDYPGAPEHETPDGESPAGSRGLEPVAQPDASERDSGGITSPPLLAPHSLDEDGTIVWMTGPQDAAYPPPPVPYQWDSLVLHLPDVTTMEAVERTPIKRGEVRTWTKPASLERIPFEWEDHEE